MTVGGGGQGTPEATETATAPECILNTAAARVSDFSVPSTIVAMDGCIYHEV